MAHLRALFFCFVLMVQLTIVSVSPVWDKVSFLDYTHDGRTIHFGVFGYTGSRVSVGYAIPPSIFAVPNIKLDSPLIHHLTVGLILHPIAAGLAAIAVVFGVYSFAGSPTDSAIMMLAGNLAMILSFIAWVIDMVLWGIVRHRIHSSGATAHYGNANWLAFGVLPFSFYVQCTTTTRRSVTVTTYI